MTLSPIEEAALAYAAAGRPVFPADQAKKPLVKWKDAATTDPETIRGWWQQWPDAMIGLPTGGASGLYVVDLDTDKATGAPKGRESLKWSGLLGALDGAPHARTPSGGEHYYFRSPGGDLGNTAGKLGEGVDTRGEGGYVIAAPSRNGVGSYEWAGVGILDADPPTVPRAILDALDPPKPATAPLAFLDAPADPAKWAATALQGELGKVAVAVEGQRNHQLNASAFALGQIIAAGHLDRGRVEAALLGAALGAGLDAAEVRATVKSGLAAGENEPRGPATVAISATPQGHSAETVATIARIAGSPAQNFSEPTPLMRQLPVATPYPLDALGPLADAARAVQAMTQAPPAIAAQSVLGVASLAVQGLADAMTLHGPAPASLYLLTIAESGERKSGCDRLAMQAVRDYQQELADGFGISVSTWRNAHDVWNEQRKKILRAKDGLDELKADLHALGPEPAAPIKPVIVTGDPSLEGITKNMGELRAALGLFADDGGTFIGGHGMQPESRLKTISGLSKLWDGGEVTRLRAGDGVSLHTGKRLSIHLMVQPIAALKLTADPMAKGQGILARFLAVQPASAIGGRLNRKTDPASQPALNAFTTRIGDLLRRPMPLREGKRNELDLSPVQLDDAARALLADFADTVETAQAEGGKLETIRPFASKAAEHAARLATVLAIYRDPDARTVTDDDIADAMALAGYYIDEALRLAEAAEIDAATGAAQRMLDWLHSARWPEISISATDAAQYSPFRDTAQARAILKRLEAFGWLIPQPDGAEIKGKYRRDAWRIVTEAAP